MSKIYNIGKVTDVDGNPKEIPSSWYVDYIIHYLNIGRSAYFLDLDSGKSLITSTVNNISFKYDGSIIVTTRNSIYHFVLKRGE